MNERIEPWRQVQTEADSFIDHAENLLEHGNALYWTVFGDAVTAIKVELQTYLSYAAEHGADSQQQAQFAQARLSNDLPTLMTNAESAGLDLRELRREIRDTNAYRNRRIHDDPGLALTLDQTRTALALAKRVRGRILNQVNADRPVQTTAAPRLQSHSSEMAVRPQHPQAGALPTPRPPQPATTDRYLMPPARQARSAGPAIPAPGVTTGQTADAPPSLQPETVTAESEPVCVVSLDAGRQVRRKRSIKVLEGILIAATLALILVVGTLAGIGISYSGVSPAWLTSLARATLPTSSTGTSAVQPVAPTPTAAATSDTTSPISAGSVLVTPQPCIASARPLRLTNTGSASAQWAIGGTQGAVTITTSLASATSPSGSALPAIFGTLAAGTTTTVYLLNDTRAIALTVTSTEGAATLEASSC